MTHSKGVEEALVCHRMKVVGRAAVVAEVDGRAVGCSLYVNGRLRLIVQAGPMESIQAHSLDDDSSVDKGCGGLGADTDRCRRRLGIAPAAMT